MIFDRELYILNLKLQYIAFLDAKMEKLGKQIAERRKKKGLSQQDLAEMSGVSRRTINSVEQGWQTRP